ncbi:hypothetical protein EXN22_16305 [Pseudomonas tructae]|uniref:DnaT DNA-binding domain-containing protein n=1 Tax=Pseudomonas tructae TaxID=2518644 RepID=A0A411MK85_9PSED|nr:DnaT-like ssDNA-binding domain-containing protein [Pseudomonas tructae]QBF27177.1 hypothetical protein EXN22_16305 [Pseudomonas tructae]
MAAFQINDDEWGALAEEPAELLKLYCAIRKVMDYRTGIAGKSRRISEQMLREVLYVAPLPGRHAPPEVTRQKVRSLLKRLETLGLTVSLGPLVLQLPLATSDGPSKTGATKEQPEQKPDEQPQQNSEIPNEYGDLPSNAEEAATVGESSEAERNNLPPVSGKSPTTLSARGYFAMHDGWQSEAKTWNATALRNAIPKRVPDETLNEFRSYWIARPEKEQSQAQWEHQLAQSLKHKLRQAQAGGYPYGPENSRPLQAKAHQKRPGGQVPGSQGGGRQRQDNSAVGQVRASIAAREEREQREQAAPAAAGQALAEDGGDVRAPLDVEFRRIS